MKQIVYLWTNTMKFHSSMQNFSSTWEPPPTGTLSTQIATRLTNVTFLILKRLLNAELCPTLPHKCQRFAKISVQKVFQVLFLIWEIWWPNTGEWKIQSVSRRVGLDVSLLKVTENSFQQFPRFCRAIWPSFIRWCYNHVIKTTAQSLVNMLSFLWHNRLP